MLGSRTAHRSADRRVSSLGHRASRQVPSRDPKWRRGGAGRADREGVLRDRLAKGHHDITLVDELGRLVAKKPISETVDGFAELTAMLARAHQTPPGAPPRPPMNCGRCCASTTRASSGPSPARTAARQQPGHDRSQRGAGDRADTHRGRESVEDPNRAGAAAGAELMFLDQASQGSCSDLASPPAIAGARGGRSAESV